MKVNGPLTHARFAAEMSRIIRVCSKFVAHETLRMHTGGHDPQKLVAQVDVDSFRQEINNIMERIKTT